MNPLPPLSLSADLSAIPPREESVDWEGAEALLVEVEVEVVRLLPWRGRDWSPPILCGGKGKRRKEERKKKEREEEEEKKEKMERRKEEKRRNQRSRFRPFSFLEPECNQIIAVGHDGPTSRRHLRLAEDDTSLSRKGQSSLPPSLPSLLISSPSSSARPQEMSAAQNGNHNHENDSLSAEVRQQIEQSGQAHLVAHWQRLKDQATAHPDDHVAHKNLVNLTSHLMVLPSLLSLGFFVVLPCAD